MSVSTLALSENHTLPVDDPVAKIDALNQYAWDIIRKDTTLARTMSEEAQSLSTSAPFDDEPYQAGLAESLHVQGYANLRFANYELGFSQLAESMALFEETSDVSGQAKAVTAFGVGYYFLCDYSLALDFWLRSLSLFEKNQDLSGTIRQLNNVGLLHIQLKEPEKGEAYLRRALKLSPAAPQKDLLADTYDNLSQCRYLLGDYDEALNYAKKAIALFEEIGVEQGQSEALNNIGNVYAAQENYPLALTHYRQALTLSQRTNHRPEAIRAMLHIAAVYVLQNSLSMALPILQQAQAEAEAIDAKAQLSQCHHSLSNFYELRGDMAMALQHYKQHHQIEQVIFSADADRKIKLLQIQYETADAKKEARIHRLKTVELEQEIKKRKRTESALRERNEELDRFAHTVAHDLKGPQGTIGGAVEYLLDENDHITEDERIALLQIIERAGAKSTAIIDALLLLSRVRRTDVKTSPVNMIDVVSQAKNRLMGQIQAQSAKLILPSAWPMALGYAPWLEEVWVNYMSNALKYGGSPPRLELGAGSPAEGFVKFWVKDNGAGLSQKAQDALFMEFSRTPGNTVTGHGLGLSIVRRIVEKIGGQVGVESAVGQGSTFFFTLPIAPEA